MGRRKFVRENPMPDCEAHQAVEKSYEIDGAQKFQIMSSPGVFIFGKNKDYLIARGLSRELVSLFVHV
jgi:hypothetical protein